MHEKIDIDIRAEGFIEEFKFLLSILSSAETVQCEFE